MPSQSHRPDLVNSHDFFHQPERKRIHKAKSQSHRPDLVNSHISDGPRAGQSWVGRNPTVLIWSIPTMGRPSYSTITGHSRNPTVLIWSIPTDLTSGGPNGVGYSRNPTVLIWSIPTILSRVPTQNRLEGRNPTVLIWSIPTKIKEYGGEASFFVAIPPS